MEYKNPLQLKPGFLIVEIIICFWAVFWISISIRLQKNDQCIDLQNQAWNALNFSVFLLKSWKAKVPDVSFYSSRDVLSERSYLRWRWQGFSEDSYKFDLSVLSPAFTRTVHNHSVILHLPSCYSKAILFCVYSLKQEIRYQASEFCCSCKESEWWFILLRIKKQHNSTSCYSSEVKV